MPVCTHGFHSVSELSNFCVSLQSCIKPQHQEVKLELELDMQSPNYDTSRGEQIAWNVDGVARNKDERKTEEKFFKKLVVLLLLSCIAISNIWGNFIVKSSLFLSILLMCLSPLFSYCVLCITR